MLGRLTRGRVFVTPMAPHRTTHRRKQAGIFLGRRFSVRIVLGIDACLVPLGEAAQLKTLGDIAEG